jgi:hypothetical protein
MGGFTASWHLAKREIAVAAGLVSALSVAAWVLLGPAAAALVALTCLALGLLGLRALLPRQEPQALRQDPYQDMPLSSFSGFWRTRTDLASAIASLSAWDLTTRPRLQRLLAARLAERHGISMAADPQAARAIFLDGVLPSRTPRTDLWFWIDPSRPTPANAANLPGIPPRVLTALIARLEQL